MGNLECSRNRGSKNRAMKRAEGESKLKISWWLGRIDRFYGASPSKEEGGGGLSQALLSRKSGEETSPIGGIQGKVWPPEG